MYGRRARGSVALELGALDGRGRSCVRSRAAVVDTPAAVCSTDTQRERRAPQIERGEDSEELDAHRGERGPLLGLGQRAGALCGWRAPARLQRTAELGVLAVDCGPSDWGGSGGRVAGRPSLWLEQA